MELVLVNKSFENFSCIGGNCEESCCKGWNINIDESTYNLYMTASEDKVMNFRDNLIVLPDSERTQYRYAVIRNCKGLCVFLAEDGFCKIHSRYGSQALSNICNTFPRMVNSFNGAFELSWDTSCPEVVRFLMKSDNNNFELLDASKFLSGVFSLSYIYNKEQYVNEWQYFLKEIRERIQEVYSETGFSIEERLFIIGTILYNVQALVDDNKLYLILDYLNKINFITIKSEFHKIKTDTEKNFNFLYEIFSSCDDESLYRKQFIEMINSKDLENKNNAILDFLKTSKMVEKEFSFFIENYISNLMMTKMFPLTIDNNIFQEFSKLVIDYSLLKFHLAFYFCDESGSVRGDLVKIVVNYSKSIGHNKKFLEKIYRNTSDFSKFEAIMSLIK